MLNPGDVYLEYTFNIKPSIYLVLCCTHNGSFGQQYIVLDKYLNQQIRYYSSSLDKDVYEVIYTTRDSNYDE